MIEYDPNSFPHIHVAFDQWVTWTTIEDRKQPYSPWSDADNQYSWSNPENLTDYDTATKWADMHPDLAGLGFIIQSESDPYTEPADPTALIDFDDVINPETGEMHPFAEMVIRRADSYADISFTDTGAHILGIGQLPDGVRTVQDELPEHPDFPDAEIEVYDGKRFTAMSGKWLTMSNREVTDISYWLNRLARRFETESVSRTPDGERRSEVNLSNTAFADMETTDDYDKFLDAIDSVGPGDIRLTSTATQERPNGTTDYDPSFANSKSGTRLGELEGSNAWIYRNGGNILNALQVVALEDRIITAVGDYPSGESFWKAVERLRERGANVPRYEGKPADIHGFHKRNQSSSEKAKNNVKKLQMLGK